MRIRPAKAADAAALADIYAPHVLTGTATFEERPPDAAEMAGRLAHVTDAGWPWLVAEDEGGIAGYAYAAQFRDRTAYRHTAEDSIYLRPDRMGEGLGQRLLSALLEAAAGVGFQRLVAAIGDSDNLASIRLHERLGFTHAGRLARVGHKFGRWLDVVFMERDLP